MHERHELHARPDERRNWFVRIVLFLVGFTVCPLIYVIYWTSMRGSVGMPEDSWGLPLLLFVSVLGGLLSAKFGSHFWGSFLSGL